jgi:hypothetical protein
LSLMNTALQATCPSGRGVATESFFFCAKI